MQGWKKLAPLALLLPLAACATTTRTVVTDTSCKSFVPIRYSRHDTAATIQQAIEHNAAYDALCKTGRDTSCRGIAPVLGSVKDSPATVKQVREHNAAWDALCK